MLFKNSVRTSKRTPHFTVTGINWLVLFNEIIAAHSENDKNTNTKYSVKERKSVSCILASSGSDYGPVVGV
jgi:hypothetical protein